MIKEIKKLSNQGTDLKDICVVARTHKLLDEYIAQFTNAGIKTYEIKRNKLDGIVNLNLVLSRVS